MASSEELSVGNNYLNDIVVIWLDEALKNPQQLLLSQRQTSLLSCVKFTRTFTSYSECENFINQMKDLSIFFIVSGSLSKKVVLNVHDLSQMIFIYIFCANKSKYEPWTKQFNKIRGVFIDDILLLTKLKDDAKALSITNFPFGLFDCTERSLQNITEEQTSFMWFQLILETLLRLPQTSEAKTEMISECRAEFQQNQTQLDKIALFEKDYRANDAIRWYTGNTFLYQLFNKIFRKQDFEIIFKYRFYLVDLYNQQYKDQEGSLTVYRGQLMFQEELRKLEENVGQLFSINTFFSASKSHEVASIFSGNGEYRSNGIVSVIFTVTVDLKSPCRPFANISRLSYIKDEDEVLFSTGTIFRVDSVDLKNETMFCAIKLDE